jgi:hypothetical protein
MKPLGDSRKHSKHIGLVFLAAAALSVAACGTTSTTSSEREQLMFVQSAEDLKVNPAASAFRLVKVNQQTLYFSDRPLREAGNLKLADYLFGTDVAFARPVGVALLATGMIVHILEEPPCSNVPFSS